MKRCAWALLVVLVAILHDVTGKNTALLIIDVQNCFLPSASGSLAVTDGDAVIPVIKSIREKYKNDIALTVFTQDWHCSDHVSFASQHTGSNLFDVINLEYNETGGLCQNDPDCIVAHNISQTLWPDHCVINTSGAQISTLLNKGKDDVIVRKGYHCQVDSYSGFFDNGGFSQTELDEILKEHEIQRLIVAGLAWDFCVYFTSVDGEKLGYDVYAIKDASRPVSQDNVDRVEADMRSKGVKIIDSSQLDTVMASSASSAPSNRNQIVKLMFDICTFLFRLFS